MKRFTGCGILIAGLAITAQATATTVNFTTPSDDRWHYPFGFSGSRAVAGCFSSLGTGVPGFDNFNDRDGCLIVAWNTTSDIPAGQGAAAYNVQRVTVTLKNEPAAQWIPDTTPDEWFAYDVNNDGAVNIDGIPRGQPGDTDGESADSDPGRPIELFGAGFGPVYTSATWTENSAYVGATNVGNAARDPFPFVYQDGTLALLHCEDSAQGGHNGGLPTPVFNFTPTPWAVGVASNYTPGAQTEPFDVVFDIDLTLSGGAVRAYFQEQLNSGKVFVYVTSLTETVQGGPASGYPSFYNKEGVPLHPLARAPQLTIVLGSDQPGDVNGDGCVNLADLATLLAHFGTASGAAPTDGDLDGDGDVDLSDLATLLANFGAGVC